MTGKLARWSLRFSEYEFDVVNRLGLKHQVSGALLRFVAGGLEHRPVDDDIHILLIKQPTVTVHEFIDKNSNEKFCKKAAATIRMPQS